MTKIAILNDFLRDTPNGLANSVENRRWLAAKTTVLGRGQYRVVEYGYDQPNEQHTNILQYMDVLGLPCGPESWRILWDSMPSDHFCELISDNLANPDCVVGFGLPNILVRAFDKLSIPFIDFEISLAAPSLRRATRRFLSHTLCSEPGAKTSMTRKRIAQLTFSSIT